MLKQQNGRHFDEPMEEMLKKFQTAHKLENGIEEKIVRSTMTKSQLSQSQRRKKYIEWKNRVSEYLRVPEKYIISFKDSRKESWDKFILILAI